MNLLKHLRPITTAVLISLGTHTGTANAVPASVASAATGFSFAVASTVISGDPVLLNASGGLIVKSVQIIGGGSIAVFEGVSDAAKYSIQFSGEAAGALSRFTGATIQAVAELSGVMLVSGGELIAFIPNELGQQLLSREKFPGESTRKNPVMSVSTEELI